MRTGTLSGAVVAFDAPRGLGEVEDGEGRRYPFHFKRIAGEAKDIVAGAKVDFEIAPGHLGRWEAVRVRARG